jgi:hypothetical protein
MSAVVHREFDRNLEPRERNWGFPRLALRQRAADHPMIMFLVVAAAAFTAMALMPPAGSAFATLGTAPQTVQTKAGTNEQPNVGLSEIDIACSGQAWGAQTPECLAMIAKDSGRGDGRVIRVIAGA